MAGICGSVKGELKIINSCNNGNVKGTYGGGIVGSAKNNAKIINSYNTGNLILSSGGGMAFGIENGDILNSYNLGASTASGDSVGGIVGKLANENIAYTYNLGQVNSGSGAGLVGTFSTGTGKIINSYNINDTYFKVSNRSENIGLINADYTFPNSQPYDNLITALNAWVNANKTTYPELKNWVVGEGGYPVFE